MQIKFKTLSALMPIKAMQDSAWDETRNVTERHDVPSGSSVPADLRDKFGRFFRTREGYRIAGRLLIHDMLDGSPSSAVPLIYGCYPLLAFVLTLGTTVGILGSAVVTILNLVWVFTVLSFTGIGFLGLNLLGLLVIVGMATGLGAFASIFSFIPVVGPQIVALTSGHEGGSLLAFIGSLIPGLLPLLPARSQARDRARSLAAQGSLCNIESMGTHSDTHVESRRIQTETAAKDTSPFFRLGEATGFCTSQWDGYAPDARLPVGLTDNDLSTHLICFGKTGSGKTSRVLKVLAEEYARSEVGGMLVLDGKGSLPGELAKADLPGYKVVEPGQQFIISLTEGLDAATIADTIAALSAGSDDGDSAFFTNSGHTLLFASCTILHAMVEAGRKAVAAGSDTERTWFWTLSNIHVLANQLASDSAYAESICAHVKNKCPEANTPGSLKDAVAYWNPAAGQFHSMDEKTRSNILSTVNAWLAPLFTHDSLRVWADAETGLRIEECLEGGRIGINVPVHQYKKAGLLVVALVKGRVFNGIRKRGSYGDEWQQLMPDQKPLLCLVDECQEVISKEAEGTLLPVARSLGARCVYSSQSVDSFVAKLGETAAIAMLDNFVSFMTFNASPLTIKWVVSQVGYSQQLVYKTKGMGIDYDFTASLASSSPLRDPAHPDKKIFRNLLRDMKAGSVKTVSDKVFGKAGGGIKKAFGGRTSASDNDISFNTATEINPVVGGEFVLGPVVDEKSLGAQLATPGYAFLQVNRGGVRRRDVVIARRADEWKEIDDKAAVRRAAA